MGFTGLQTATPSVLDSGILAVHDRWNPETSLGYLESQYQEITRLEESWNLKFQESRTESVSLHSRDLTQHCSHLL